MIEWNCRDPTTEYIILLDFWGSYGGHTIQLSFGMWNCVVWQIYTSVSKKPATCIMRVNGSCVSIDDGGSRFPWNTIADVLDLRESS